MENLEHFQKIKPILDNFSPNSIIVWPFEEAPRQYREMSNNGGDEDWVALVPPSVAYVPLWLEHLDVCQEPQIYKIADGYKIYIGSHS